MSDLQRSASHQDVPTPEQIARRAYELYEQRGRENGRDMEDWLAAERELRNQNLIRPQPASIMAQKANSRGSREGQAKARAASASEPSKSFDRSSSLDRHSTQ